jgi:hypothetical protein
MAAVRKEGKEMMNLSQKAYFVVGEDEITRRGEFLILR